MSKRHRGRFGYPADDPFRPTCHPERLKEPLRWKKTRRVFVTSMGDLFHEQIPYDFVKQVFDVCWRVNSDRLNTSPTHQPHTFMFLTKRPKRMGELWRLYLKEHRDWDEKIGLDYLDREVARTFLFGTSVETKDQGHRIADLLAIPEVRHWVSLEPLLGPVDLDGTPAGQALGPCGQCGETKSNLECEACMGMPSLDLVVVGGESGPGARPLHPDWVRSIRDECQEAGVAFYFKQWGHFTTCTGGWAGDLILGRDGSTKRIHKTGDQDLGDGEVVIRPIGKKAAGRLLDGRTWEEFSEVRR